MSTLQISLLAIGALVVLAVYVFNVVQERRIRRRIQRQFAGVTEQPTRDPAARVATRIEPSLRAANRSEVAASPAEVAVDAVHAASAANAVDDHPAAAPATRATAAAAQANVARQPTRPAARSFEDQPDADTELVIVFRLRQPHPAASLRADSHGEFGKAVRWFGRRGSEPWVPLRDGHTPEMTEIAACLMLVDRDGPLSVAQLQTFLRMVTDRAASLPADIESPNVDEVLEKARTLDRICAEVDVQVGINLVRPVGATPPTLAGTRLRGVAEAAGFRLTGNGQFEYVSEDTEQPLFCLQGQRGEALTPETLRTMQAAGLTLLLDVPRTPDAVKAFDQMRAIGKRLGATLEAVLVDDNRKPLSDAALGTIREQVHQTVAAMRASHIEPGSARALRLFR